MDAGTILGLLGFLSVDGLSRCRHPDDNTASTQNNRQKHAINTAPMRAGPNSQGRATDLHDRDTDYPGPTRQRHGLSRHPYGPNTICAGPTTTSKKEFDFLLFHHSAIKSKVYPRIHI
ncbi:hypothetical protein DPMN_136905 [Dreissena polymorpha]|uniref:Secreted protein n=1 Tax=Dreissena polymorpha TaxID=45954 RepID=A0A9D4JH60_DREPO|nr:hypothetical protein DPMN_136905 [Dreissena polymorpha]